jgi:hypothetical protein
MVALLAEPAPRTDSCRVPLGGAGVSYATPANRPSRACPDASNARLATL